MNNLYEFDIDEIKSVTVIDTEGSCNYKTEYTRIETDNGNTYFLERIYSDPIIEGNRVKVVCQRCGHWNSFSLKEFNSDEFDPDSCTKCSSTYENLYSEDEMINIIMSFLEKDTFKGIKLFINDIEIV